MVIWPEAIKAQNSMAAISADGRAHWVLMRRLNSSCRRSMALVVRNDFHCSGDVSQEGEQPFSRFLQAVHHASAPEPPLGEEGLVLLAHGLGILGEPVPGEILLSLQITLIS